METIAYEFQNLYGWKWVYDLPIKSYHVQTIAPNSTIPFLLGSSLSEQSFHKKIFRKNCTGKKV